jgi:DNA-binding HxlR family transcriptional regulator
MSTSQHSIDGDARTPGLPAGQELFALLGERWNNVILRQVFFGVQRFGALQRALGIAPSTLTARLADLVAAGLLERHRYRQDKDWFDYRLTPDARELVPAWVTMARWAEIHLNPGHAGRYRMRHTNCGHLAEPQLVCAHCGEVLHGQDLEPLELPTEDDDPADTTAGTEPEASPGSGRRRGSS